MPLDALDLAASLKFTLSKAVSGWPDITQGENSLTASLEGIDLDNWNQAYAAVHTLAAAATATVDLASFTNLATESVTLVSALGIVIQVAHTTATDTDGELTIGAGATNGLTAWFLPSMVIPAPPTGSRTVVMCGDADDAGVTVSGTSKTIDLENTGTDSITVTLVVIGATA